MPSTEAPNWWADVQQDREELTGRRVADDWLEEELDFAPRRRFPRGVADDATGADTASHGVFVHAESAATGRRHRPVQPAARTVEVTGAEDASRRPVARTIEVTVGDDADLEPVASRVEAADALDELRSARMTERSAAAHAPVAGRRTVQITGRPEDRGGAGAASSAARRARRPRTAGERVGHRPDRIAMWAVLMGAVLILLAAFSADSQAATSLGDRTLKTGMVGRDVRHLQQDLRSLGFLRGPADARFGTQTRIAVKRYQRSRCLTADGVAGPATIRAIKAKRRACRGRGRSGAAKRSAYLRVDLGARTLARGMAGRDVRTLQRLLGVTSTGTFGPITARAVRSFQRRAGLGVDGAVGPATKAALVQREMRPRTATYYGPGLYGNRTACGQKLTRRLVGVAHRRLPCGATVTLHHAGRFLTARVVDRGPFKRGVTFDLTSAAAKRLGLDSTVRLRAKY